MALDNAKNFAKVTVDGTYDDTATSIDLITGDGAKLPTPPFNLVWWNSTDFPDPSDDVNGIEIVRCTAIATDTLTITRGQEGTSGVTHELEAKVYRMIAGPTAKTFNTDILRSDAAQNTIPIADANGNFNGSPITLASGVLSAAIEDVAGFKFDGPNATSAIGDVNDSSNGTKVRVDDVNSRIEHQGKIATDQSASATVAVGTLAAKMPIYDNSGTLLGYIPIYNSIT